MFSQHPTPEVKKLDRLFHNTLKDICGLYGLGAKPVQGLLAGLMPGGRISEHHAGKRRLQTVADRGSATSQSTLCLIAAPALGPSVMRPIFPPSPDNAVL
jgi:hypothetical protein